MKIVKIPYKVAKAMNTYQKLPDGKQQHNFSNNSEMILKISIAISLKFFVFLYLPSFCNFDGKIKKLSIRVAATKTVTTKSDFN